MSKPNTPRSNSQAKKTAMAIISDPTQYKKPTMNDIRNENQFKYTPIGGDEEESAPAFQKPSISQLHQESPQDNGYKRPSIADLHNEPLPVAPSNEYKKPSINTLKNEMPHVEFSLDIKEEPNYKPYTVEEYREMREMENLDNRGGLGPSLDDEWERKREMRTKIMQFAQKTAQENKSVIPKRVKPRQPPKKGPSKRDKMKEYAKNLPKPKASPKTENKAPRPKPKPVKATYDIEAELARHAHFVSRVQSLRNSLSSYLSD